MELGFVLEDSASAIADIQEMTAPFNVRWAATLVQAIVHAQCAIAGIH
jgi:hypothetical protein